MTINPADFDLAYGTIIGDGRIVGGSGFPEEPFFSPKALRISQGKRYDVTIDFVLTSGGEASGASLWARSLNDAADPDASAWKLLYNDGNWAEGATSYTVTLSPALYDYNAALALGETRVMFDLWGGEVTAVSWVESEMPHSDWLTDAAENWVSTASATTGNPATANGYASEGNDASYPAAVARAWAGPPWTADYQPGFNVQTTSSGFSANWSHAWVTIHRSDSHEVTKGVLPPGIVDGAGNYLDPNVVGVEWEPTSIPDAQRLTVSVRKQGTINPRTVAGETIHVKAAMTAGVPYSPPFQTGTAVAAMVDVAIMDAATSGEEVSTEIVASCIWDAPPLAATGSAALAVTLLDNSTQQQVPPEMPPTGQRSVRFPFEVLLEADYRPRYRLIYRTAIFDPPYLRNVQRGDGLGFSSAPRAIQNNSVQGSLRNFGFN